MLPPEEIARARIYGLLARLLSAPPDAALLEAIAASDETDAQIRLVADPWTELAHAAAATTAEAVRDEFEHVRRRSAALLERTAALCDCLGVLIHSGSAGIAQQERFFRAELLPAARRLRGLAGTSRNRFYRHVGRFAAAFFRLEQAAFQLSEPQRMH